MLTRRSILGASAALFAATFNQAQAQFQNGEFVTYSQFDWGAIGNPASQLLESHFVDIYPNGAVMGIVGPAGNLALLRPSTQSSVTCRRAAIPPP